MRPVDAPRVSSLCIGTSDATVVVMVSVHRAVVRVSWTGGWTSVGSGRRRPSVVQQAMAVRWTVLRQHLAVYGRAEIEVAREFVECPLLWLHVIVTLMLTLIGVTDVMPDQLLVSSTRSQPVGSKAFTALARGTLATPDHHASMDGMDSGVRHVAISVAGVQRGQELTGVRIDDSRGTHRGNERDQWLNGPFKEAEFLMRACA
jgi:hypothetical protein